ncbi:MAG TPA: hypothetical protein VG650_03095 [Mycobacteriales bacterium]|nr:hypothetical protein [Mycobacteriales bacterium]
MSGVAVTAVRRPKARVLTIAAGAATLAVVIGGCGSGSPSPGAAAESPGGGLSTSAFDVVAGKVIAATSSSASVQTASGPSSVAFSATTRFTKTSPTTRSALAKGDCVTVTATAPPASAGTTTTTTTRTITARVVTLTSTSGCSQAFPGRGFGGTPPSGTFGRGFTGAPPSGGFGGGGAPRPFPTGSPGAGRPGRFGGPGTVQRALGALGSITSLTAHSLQLTSTFGQTTTTTTVDTTSATSYVTVADSSAIEVVKGSCVSAVGTTDVSGLLDARSVAISQPVGGQCRAAATPFGGGRFFSRGGYGGPQGAGSA